MLAWVHVGWDVLCVHTCFIFELPMHLLHFNARLKNSHRALQLIPLLLKSLKPCCSCFSSNCRKSLAVSSRSCHRDFCSVSACCLANMFFFANYYCTACKDTCDSCDAFRHTLPSKPPRYVLRCSPQKSNDARWLRQFFCGNGHVLKKTENHGTGKTASGSFQQVLCMPLEPCCWCSLQHHLLHLVWVWGSDLLLLLFHGNMLWRWHEGFRHGLGRMQVV